MVLKFFFKLNFPSRYGLPGNPGAVVKSEPVVKASHYQSPGVSSRIKDKWNKCLFKCTLCGKVNTTF